MDKESAEVVVVGGGVRGLSVAYYLAKAGVNVVLVEKRFVAAGASGLSMGYVNISGKSPDPYTRLSKISADLFPALNDELEGEIEYERNGSVRMAVTEKDWNQLSKAVDDRNRTEGVNMRMVGIEEMRKMEPALSPELLGGYWCPIDGGVNSLKLTRAFAKHAKGLGARIYTGCEVRDIRVARNRIEGAVTNRMTIATHVVVNTAGIHTSQIAAMVGMKVPVFPERGQLTITEALPRLIHRTVGSYKQFENGQFLLGVSNELVGENTRVTTEMITTRVRVATQILPPLKAVRAARCAAALRPMTPDRLPIFEKMQGVSDFYVAVGHSGVTLAPVTGKALTDLITGGRTDLPISEYSMERFKETQGARSEGS